MLAAGSACSTSSSRQALAQYRSRGAAQLVACAGRPRAVSRALSVQAAAAPVAPVKITIQGRRLTVTDPIKQYVEGKVSKAVHNFAPLIKRIDVTLSARGGDTGTHGAKQQKVDVTIHTMRAGVVRVEDAEESLYASIDVVCDKVTNKLRRIKEKSIAKGTWPGRAAPRKGLDVAEEDFQEYMSNLIVETVAFSEEAALAAEAKAAAEARRSLGSTDDSEELPSAVKRSKVLRLEPMSLGDAIEALEAVGHDFYLFKEAGTGSMQVVYKRESGGYGILIPQ